MIWWLLQVAYLLCLIVMLLLPAHRYEWMHELDPGFPGSLPAGDSSDRRVTVMVLLVVALLAQALCAWLAGTRARRWLALALSGIAVAVVVIRFGVG